MLYRQPPTPEQAEVKRLHDGIHNFVNNVNLDEVAVFTRDCRTFPHFSLVPICGRLLRQQRYVGPTDIAAYDVLMPSDITFGVDSSDQRENDFTIHKPHLDSPQAIGIAKDNHLLAILGFRFSFLSEPETQVPARVFNIVQIQDVTEVRKPTTRALYTTKLEYDARLRKYYRTGLHDGLDWKATLVQSCEAIGRLASVDIVRLQSHVNSKWRPVRKRGRTTYDAVAEQLGYEQLANNDWQKTL